MANALRKTRHQYLILRRAPFEEEIEIEYPDGTKEELSLEQFYSYLYRDLAYPETTKLADMLWNFGLVIAYPETKTFETL